MPNLIFICGKAGVGKSTLARALAREIKAVLLDKDDIAEPLCPNDRESAAYMRLHLPIYNVLFTLAKTNLDLGLDVIIDSPFTSLMSDEAWWAGVKKLPAKIYVIRAYCDEATNLSRLKSRGLARDASKLADYAGSLIASPLMFEILEPHLDVNSAEDMQDNLVKCLGYIKS